MFVKLLMQTDSLFLNRLQKLLKNGHGKILLIILLSSLKVKLFLIMFPLIMFQKRQFFRTLIFTHFLDRKLPLLVLQVLEKLQQSIFLHAFMM